MLRVTFPWKMTPERADRKRVQARAWKLRNKDRCLAYQRKYLAANPTPTASHAAYVRRWQKRHPHTIKAARAAHGIRRNAALWGYSPLIGISVAQLAEALRTASFCQCGVRCTEDTILGRRSASIGGRTAYVEHCHTTGIFRGIVCKRCNDWIGRCERSGMPSALLDNYLQAAVARHEYFSTLTF